MPEKPLTKLRRQRRRVIAQLVKLEPLTASYRDKLARIEARIQELDPQLWMPPRHYRPNPVFARGELPRIAINIMREEGTPLSTLTLAMRALAQKGVTQPGPGLRKLIRIRLTQMMGKLEKRGIVRRVGRNKATQNVLVADEGFLR